MTRPLVDPSATALSGSAAAAGADAPSGEGLRDRLHNVGRVCRQLFGIPDYERYLAHATVRHPGEPVLSRRDFCARAIEHKYGKSGPRCC